MRKKPKWFTIMAPRQFGGKEIGVTPATDPKMLLDRRVAVNVAELTGDPTRYYMKLIFRIRSWEGERALTVFDRFDVFRDHIARMVHKYLSRIDIIQDLETHDGRRVRVKSVCTLPTRVKTSIERSVRKRIAELVGGKAKELDLHKFVKATIAGEIKTHVMKQASNVYPIKDFEVRRIELLD
jgi:small subunit ribosomal protein S3Ae